LPGAWFSVPDFDDRVPDYRELLDAVSDASRASADAASEVFRAADAASDEFRAADAASDAFRAAGAVSDVLRAVSDVLQVAAAGRCCACPRACST
jgi:hypothetical protein